MVAGTLAALGTAHSAHTAATAFGAISTMNACILTYLKGKGLLIRMEFYEIDESLLNTLTENVLYGREL